MARKLKSYESDGSYGPLELSVVFTEEGFVKCPQCGNYYTHLENIIPYSTDVTRPCVELVFSCEHCSTDTERYDGDNGARFSICVQQHEGMTYLSSEQRH